MSTIEIWIYRQQTYDNAALKITCVAKASPLDTASHRSRAHNALHPIVPTRRQNHPTRKTGADHFSSAIALFK
jgi:hypothetical protein